jgi:hypothetical protein
MTRNFAATARAAVMMSSCLLAGAATSEPVAPWPTQVNALYTLHFTGFGELGKFKFHSQIQGNDYSINGSAEVKVPLIYTWTSAITGNGKLSSDEPQPATYTFSSHGKPVIGGAKHLNVRLGFKESAVNNTSIIPPNNPGGAHYVPIKPEHLKSVIDPLTAVLVTTRAKGGSPCGRRLAIFDGKQRFDLLTTPAGQQKAGSTPSGQPATAGAKCAIFVAGYGYQISASINNSSARSRRRFPAPIAGAVPHHGCTMGNRHDDAPLMDIVTPGQKQIASYIEPVVDTATCT